MRNRIRAIVIKAKSIDQPSLLWQTKDPRFWISRLWLGCDRADFNKTKAESGPRRQGQAILIQAGGQADWIWKNEAEEFFGGRVWLKASQPPKNRARPPRGAE